MYSDLEFVLRPDNELFGKIKENDELKGWIIKSLNNDKIEEFERQRVIVYVKKKNSRYAILRIKDVLDEKEKIKVNVEKQLYGYKSSIPSENRFFREYGVPANFRVHCSYRDRGLILAKVDYEKYPFLKAFNNHSFNSPILEIEVETKISKVDKLVKEILETLTTQEIKELIEKLNEKINKQ